MERVKQAAESVASSWGGQNLERVCCSMFGFIFSLRPAVPGLDRVEMSIHPPGSRWLPGLVLKEHRVY